MHCGRKHYVKAAIVGKIHNAEKYYDKRFLCYNGDMSINFLSILFHYYALVAQGCQIPWINKPNLLTVLLVFCFLGSTNDGLAY